MKNLITFAILLMVMAAHTGCKKEATIDNEKNIKKSWKLDMYFVNSVDKTASLTVTSYNESYTDNQKYDRSFTDKNGNKVIQNGTWEFESAQRLKISGVGSVEFTNNNTASSSYYDIIKLTDAELWYTFTNGNSQHEFHFSRK